VNKSTKVANIPNWVQSSVQDISISASDVRKRIGSYQYIIIADCDTSMDIVAAPHAKDVPFYAAYFRVFKNSEMEPGKRVFLHGRVMDPESLPYEIESGQHVFVLFDEWFFQMFNSMAKAITFLNDFIIRTSVSDTSTLLIMIGHRYGEGVLASANSSIERLEKDLWGPE
jgi:hypothetical protein